jgi:hypothetical protein
MVGVPCFSNDVARRPVLADRLALALFDAHLRNQPWAEHEHQKQRGHQRATGPERDVAKHVEGGNLVSQIKKQMVEHIESGLRHKTKPRQMAIILLV